MRVIAGEAKGLRLKRPAVRYLRPTSDLVRGAIFDMLASLGVDMSRVLDLYAGSGALGIEALSRGAHWCDFVEQDRAACATIRENLALAGFQERGQVHCLPVERALKRLVGPYRLVLVDPPYEDEAAMAVLAQLTSSPLVGPGSTLVLEHPWRRLPADQWGPFALVSRKRHGDTGISIYR
ncbi:MAG: 16S rRNA (guanine(966)-N(2))-methyltransferase RsmD [Dehalococcoidia bacterium]